MMSILQDYEMANKLLEEYQKVLIAKIEQLERERDAAVETQPKWISVEERLPEEFEDVLVFSRNGSRTWTEVAHLTRNQWWRVGIPMINVTHWMPLPEPPKEE